MRCIGFLSAGEPDTTALYWRLFHDEIRRRTGCQHTGRIVAESIDGSALAETTRGRRLIAAARRVEKHGARGVLLCSPALHVLAPAIRDAVTVPVLHVAMAMTAKLRELRLAPPALLGVERNSGEQQFWQSTLAEDGVKKTIWPTALDTSFVQDQLRRGITPESVTDEMRAAFIRLSVDLKHAGARIIVLTRPELSLALREEDAVIPTLCMVQAHCEQAANFALDREPVAGN